MKFKNTEKSYIFPANSDFILKNKEPGTYYFSLVDRPVIKDSSGRPTLSERVMELKLVNKDGHIEKRIFQIIDDRFVPSENTQEISLKNYTFSNFKQIKFIYEEYGLNKPIYRKLTPLIFNDSRFHNCKNLQEARSILEEKPVGSYLFYSESKDSSQAADSLMLAYRGVKDRCVYAREFTVVEYLNQTEIYSGNLSGHPTEKFVNFDEIIFHVETQLAKSNSPIGKVKFDRPLYRRELDYPSDSQQPFFDQLPEDVKK